MAINGCLTLAWLEEDDPSRGFFRVRPAAVISATPQAYVHGGEYGEDGFLRVVPDKNEMSTFKLRMRTLGKLCLIDLREHPRENDKIRQNKNYALGSDRNPFMIYSDVIRELPQGLVCEVVGQGRKPLAMNTVFVSGDGALTGPYQFDGAAFKPCEGCARTPDADCAARLLELDDAQGSHVQLLVATIDNIDALQLSPISAFVPERAHPQHAAEPVPEPGPAPTAEPAPAAAAEPAADAAQKPMPYALKALKAQMGLNPRRGRSLSEVVDEQWRMRKQEELGQSVPPLAGSEPVESPAEHALNAVAAAWEFQGARAPLLKGLIAQDELVRRLFEVWTPQERSAPTDARLIELEADRLRLITEIDGLTRRSRDMKAEVLRELERTGEADAEALRNSLVLLQQQIDQRQARLEELAAQQHALEAGIAQALGRPLTERVAEQLVAERMSELLRTEPRAVEPEPEPRADEPADGKPSSRALLAPDELIDRLSLGLRAHGWQFKRDAVVHMLTVLALDRPLIATDFAGQDDAWLGEALSDALGDDGLKLRARLNGPASAPDASGRALYSVLSHPDGEPVSAAGLDAGFIVRLKAELCVPAMAAELPAIDPASYAALAAGELSDTASARLRALAARLGEFGAQVPHGAFCDCARYIAAAAPRLSGGEDMALDYAFASRILPAVLVAASDELIRALPEIFSGMSECLATMRVPLPVDR